MRASETRPLNGIARAILMRVSQELQEAERSYEGQRFSAEMNVHGTVTIVLNDTSVAVSADSS